MRSNQKAPDGKHCGIEVQWVFFAKYWRKLISPIVATLVGFGLLNVGANSIAGSVGVVNFAVRNWTPGTVTLVFG